MSQGASLLTSALRAAAILVPLLLAPPAQAASPSSDAESSLLDFLSRWFDPSTAPFIPIPEIGTDPNSGTTIGILPVFLTTTKGEITRIIAPDASINPELGFGANFRILAYPSADTQWSLVAGAKQRIERTLDGQYASGITRQEPWSYSVHGLYDRSASPRFFGIGNSSPASAQSNYTNDQAFLEASLGRNYGPAFQIAFDTRPHWIRIERGRFGGLPSTDAAFPGLAGLGGSHELLNRVFLSYDTRDSTVVPTRGTAVTGFAGFASRALLSSVSYSLFGIDARRIEPVGDRFALAGHIALRYMPVGRDAPFWALSSLGGDRSVIGEQQPLRGFGGDRFVDRNLFSTSLELRSKIFDINLFATELTFEMAPFIDAGRVFHDLGANPIDHLHVAGGIGFRAIAKPFVVGYVDIGFANEGGAVFSGINYPF